MSYFPTPLRGTLQATLGLALAACAATAAAITPEEMLAGYAKHAGVTPSAERGQRFFVEKRPNGLYDNCAACHGAVPTKVGKNLGNDKAIAPLAPAFSPKRFTDAAKTEYHFKLNCNDIVGRECTAGEKADLLAWLLTLKP